MLTDRAFKKIIDNFEIEQEGLNWVNIVTDDEDYYWTVEHVNGTYTMPKRFQCDCELTTDQKIAFCNKVEEHHQKQLEEEEFERKEIEQNARETRETQEYLDTIR